MSGDMTPEEREAYEDKLRAALDEAGVEYDGRLGWKNLEAEMEKAELPLPPKREPQDMQGGAAVKEVQVEPIAPAVDGDKIYIRTTALGTLGTGGIAPVGTTAWIKAEAFSEVWMEKTDPPAAEQSEDDDD